MKNLTKPNKILLGAAISIALVYEGYSLFSNYQANNEKAQIYKDILVPAAPGSGPKTVEEAIKDGVAMNNPTQAPATESQSSHVLSQEPAPSPTHSSPPEHTKPAAPSIARATLGEHPDREEVLATLRRFKGKDFSPILQKWASLHPEEASKMLIEISKDRKLKPELRYIALLGAVKAGGPDVIPDLVPLLNDPAYLVRYGVALALRFAKPSSPLQSFLPLLHDPAMLVREQALHSLVKVSPEKAPSFALEVFTESRNFVRNTPMPIALTALKLLPKEAFSQNPELIQRLCQLRKDTASKSFRENITQALGSPDPCPASQ